MKPSGWIGLSLLLGAGAAHGDPIQSEVAITVPERATTVRSFVRATDFSRTETHAFEIQNQVVYGVSARTNLLLSVLVLLKSERNDGATRRSSGLGDVTLLVKQRIWKRNRLQTQERVSLIGGLKLPTGESGEADRIGRLPRHLQPGSGSLDFPVGILLAHDAPTGYFANLLYIARTRDDGYRFGNLLRYDLAVTHAVTGGGPRQHFLWAVLELNGSWAVSDRQTRATVSDTGGHLLYLSPGLRLVHWSGRYVLDLSYQIPLVTSLNGSQASPERRWLIGLRANF